jgi:hypothetical protein
MSSLPRILFYPKNQPSTTRTVDGNMPQAHRAVLLCSLW